MILPFYMCIFIDIIYIEHYFNNYNLPTKTSMLTYNIIVVVNARCSVNKDDIISRIGYIRVRAKLTQKALSNAIEMNPNYINRLECQRDFLPSLEVLLKIIDVCGSTPEEFFYHDIASYEKDKEISEKLSSLPSNVQGFIMNYDPDLMELFTKLNTKYVKIKK